MRYIKLGKLSYSNKEEYIGGMLAVSKKNYVKICEEMNKHLNKKFENNRHNFIYALEYKKNEKTVQINLVQSGICVEKKMKVIIALDYFNKWEFELLNYDKIKEVEPFKITKENILK